GGDAVFVHRDVQACLGDAFGGISGETVLEDGAVGWGFFAHAPSSFLIRLASLTVAAKAESVASVERRSVGSFRYSSHLPWVISCTARLHHFSPMPSESIISATACSRDSRSPSGSTISASTSFLALALFAGTISGTSSGVELCPL